MGLVLVALEGKASFEVTVFFALAQIPMYTLPALLEPLYRRALDRSPDRGCRSRGKIVGFARRIRDVDLQSTIDAALGDARRAHAADRRPPTCATRSRR